jgi:hypothetical protein
MEDRWMEQAVKQHPFLQGLRVELDREAYKQRSLQEPRKIWVKDMSRHDLEQSLQQCHYYHGGTNWNQK